MLEIFLPQTPFSELNSHQQHLSPAYPSFLLRCCNLPPGNCVHNTHQSYWGKSLYIFAHRSVRGVPSPSSIKSCSRKREKFKPLDTSCTVRPSSRLCRRSLFCPSLLTIFFGPGYSARHSCALLEMHADRGNVMLREAQGLLCASSSAPSADLRTNEVLVRSIYSTDRFMSMA